ncbi:HypC/HybG/HupF family hydrogenase formation chaperone [Corynebacterium sp. 13CS0277]|uniref:HypC/HybG/HupF family hydrogenase formation chaperone n=1 Tax=Corynebacterium sp. 13CS0277 TaxID=2071994 RepID=UPI000D025671|nr:HypC/HybG/HupF family hydrogenase formation chaperone [Corynebacterium sp. 13CS0277]PRQ10970.1 HypC/HybG/HupF family hydrogenase formation chaperone [Corynebacterium sp. 13CS0277]
MCLGIPAHVTDVGTPPLAPGSVLLGGVERAVSFAYLPEATPGDWVLVRNGFAMDLLTEEEARETLAAIEEHQLLDVTVLPTGHRAPPAG